MTASILTNTSAMIALQTLRATNIKLAKIQGQISTGKAVAISKHNSAVFAISKVMECPTSAPLGQFDVIAYWRISGSS